MFGQALVREFSRALGASSCKGEWFGINDRARQFDEQPALIRRRISRQGIDPGYAGRHSPLVAIFRYAKYQGKLYAN